MRSFEYIITDEVGLHARPAGLLVKEAGKYEASIKIMASGKEADAKKLFALMKLGIKCNDTITVTVSGADEDAACQQLEQFFKENL